MKKLLYFYAPWCNPCKYVDREVINPLMRKSHRYKIEHINTEVDTNQCDLFEIKKVPTTIILEGDKEIYRYVGVALDMEELEKILDDHNN